MENKIILLSEERTILKQSLEGLSYDPSGNCNYIQQLRKTAYQNFPDRLLDIFANQKSIDRASPYFVFDHLPTDEIIAAPFGVCED
ncbi:hypothetical protein [Fastidiosibacter lacustris]|uniref:hypothetical protein n=1 Tax=Fastidiosibacter lacustris TaxID=2056695 RepID=UPI000E351A03|nr:hypothetical protein [Fastidiosibacter lacustris]